MSRSRAMQVVVFRAGDELFAIPLDTVAEIIGADAAGSGDGLVLRGREVPVISARDCLGVSSQYEERRGLLLHLDGGEIVITVGEVVGVREIEATEIVPVPGFFRGRTTELVMGISRVEGATVVLLRPEELRTRRGGEEGPGVSAAGGEEGPGVSAAGGEEGSGVSDAGGEA
jgi:chemotaxis signal transduction protein